MLYSVALPAVADGAPVFLAGVQTPTGNKDVLFLTTKDGRILARNAPRGQSLVKPAATGPLHHLVTGHRSNRLFVYSYGLEGRVHKYQVGDGTEITTDGWPEVATLKPTVEKGLGPGRCHGGERSFLSLRRERWLPGRRG